METAEEKVQKFKEAAEKDLKRRRMKLVLWYTRNFKPLITHTALEPIMEALGFVPLPTTTSNVGDETVSWKYYEYSGASAITTRTGALRSRPHLSITQPPNPGLPYPRIDGHHFLIYTDFMDSVSFFLRRSLSDLFHVRGLPLHPIHDQPRTWKLMIEKNLLVYEPLGTPDDPYPMDVAEDVSAERFPVEFEYVDHGQITMVPMDDIITYRPSE